jgi:hypothetical protein
MKRSLALKSEYLAPLTSDELSSVAGGATYGCLTGVYPTLNTPCPTVNECIVIGAIPSVNRACPTTDCFTGTSAHTVTC